MIAKNSFLKMKKKKNGAKFVISCNKQEELTRY